MSRSRICLVLSFAVAFGARGTAPLVQAQQGKQSEAQAQAAGSAWQQRIDAALQQKVTVDFVEKPLADVAAWLGTQTGQLVFLDRKALDDIGVGADTPLTKKFTNMSLRCVLRHMLPDLGLTWVLRDGALVVTSTEQAESQLATEVFPVLDLVRTAEATPAGQSDHDSLIDVITSTVAPQTWDNVGGPGSIGAFRGGLVISQTREVLDQVRNLLASLRQAKQLAEAAIDKPPAAVSVNRELDEPSMAEIRRALEKQVSLEFKQTSLEDVIAHLQDVTKASLVIDRRALDNCGVGADTPITFQAKAITVRHAMSQILGQIGLVWTIRDEAIVITSPEEEAQRLVTTAYPVADLLGRSEGVDMFGKPKRAANMEDLADLITSTLAPESWDQVGGPASIGHCPHIDVLIVSQSLAVHTQIADLLGQLRYDLAQRPAPATVKNPPAPVQATRVVVYFFILQPMPSPTMPSGAGAGGGMFAVGNEPPTRSRNEDKPNAGGMGAAAPIPTPSSAGPFWGRGGHNPAAQAPPVPLEKLVELITGLIEPESWTDRKDVYINTAPGRLIVRHTEHVHRQVRDLLAELGVYIQPIPSR